MVKVIYIDHSPKLYGAEKVLLNLLSMINKKEISPIVVCPKESELIELFKGEGIIVETTAMPWFTKKAGPIELILYFVHLISFSIFLWKKIITYRIEVIHANTFIAALYSIIPAKVARKPLVWHMHDILAPGLFNKIFIKLAGLGADSIICVSGAVKRRLVEFGVDAQKCFFVYNATVVRAGLENAPDKSFKKEFNLPDDAHLIGMIGQIRKGKGQAIFIKAVPEIMKHFPSARFVIVGDIMHNLDQEYKSYIQRLIESLNLKEKVILTGYRRDVDFIMGALDAVVLAAIEPDSLPTVILEAMSREKPVVASNVGGVPEIVVDGVNGFIVSPGDSGKLAEAVCKLLQDPGLMQKMGQEGKKILSEKFVPEANIEKVIRIYK